MTVARNRELTALFLAMVAAQRSRTSFCDLLRILPVRPKFKAMGLALYEELSGELRRPSEC